MTEQYPEYVSLRLAQARALLQEEEYGQMEAAALCFEVLAHFPGLKEAAELVLEAFSDPWLIRDNRKAIGRHVDEWDDRSWQQRRRLALSFRYTSRWEGRHYAPQQAIALDEALLSDVADMLDEGRRQLLQDYLLGQSRGSEMAWAIFQAAFKRTTKPAVVMLWVGHLYASQGYFAEATDVLEMLLTRYPQAENGRCLWAEVRWWRDYQERIPWIPPQVATHGQRYRKMMAQIDPEFAGAFDRYDSPKAHIPPNLEKLPDDIELPDPVRRELVSLVNETLAALPDELDEQTAVDWSYLDKLENGNIDISQFPEWAQYLLLEIDDPQQELFLKRYLLSYFSNPPLFDDEENDSASE